MIGDVVARVRQIAEESKETTIHELLLHELPSQKVRNLRPDMRIGASSLGKLCPRAYTMAYRMNVPFVDQFSADSKWLMDIGNGIHTTLQEMWFGPMKVLYGAWVCPACYHVHGEPTVLGCVLCPDVCESCGHTPGWRTNFQYREISISDDSIGIVGDMDGIGQLPGMPPEVWDIKSVGKISKYLLEEPRESDVVQLHFYMSISQMHRGRLIYVDRSAKKLSDGMIEHVVTYDSHIVNRVKNVVRDLRKALAAPKEERSLPACPHGGAFPWGPCQCTELEGAWAAYGPRSVTS